MRDAGRAGVVSTHTRLELEHGEHVGRWAYVNSCRNVERSTLVHILLSYFKQIVEYAIK